MRTKNIDSVDESSKWLTGLAVVTLILCGVILVLAIVIVSEKRVSETQKAVTGPDYNTDALGSTACDDGNSCTVDYTATVEGQAVCRNERVPSGTACTHQCLVATSGRCITGKCEGICEGYCPAFFDPNPLLCPTIQYDPMVQFAVDFSLVFSSQFCWYGKCLYMVEWIPPVDVYCALTNSLGSGFDFIPNVKGCLDWLDDSQLNKGCFKADIACVFGTPICVYQYTCSGYDIFGPDPPIVGGQKIKQLVAAAVAKDVHNVIGTRGKAQPKTINAPSTKPSTAPTMAHVRATTTQRLKTRTGAAATAGTVPATGRHTGLKTAKLASRIKVPAAAAVHKRSVLLGENSVTTAENVTDAREQVSTEMGEETLLDYIASLYDDFDFNVTEESTPSPPPV